MTKDQLIQQLQEKDKIIQDLIDKVDDLTYRLEQAEKRIAMLEAENAALKTENAELKARLNQNSKNSSKPPSSEGYQKKASYTPVKKREKRRPKRPPGKDLATSSSPRPYHPLPAKPVHMWTRFHQPGTQAGRATPGI
ncbi:MAG: DUF6444 domain-containing protein [Bacteroidales bacterium]|nr:DUF6444 domain-containing protein [Bacteroidales bacterium]